MTEPSEREAIQIRIATAIESEPFWNRGASMAFRAFPKGGGLRIVTFGVDRFLDARISIWTPTRIEVEGAGALAPRLVGTYKSETELLARLRTVARTRGRG